MKRATIALAALILIPACGYAPSVGLSGGQAGERALEAKVRKCDQRAVQGEWKLFQQTDRDKDLRISRAEARLTVFANKNFSWLDTNEDGFVSNGEFTRYVDYNFCEEYFPMPGGGNRNNDEMR